MTVFVAPGADGGVGQHRLTRSAVEPVGEVHGRLLVHDLDGADLGGSVGERIGQVPASMTGDPRRVSHAGAHQELDDDLRAGQALRWHGPILSSGYHRFSHGSHPYRYAPRPHDRRDGHRHLERQLQRRRARLRDRVRRRGRHRQPDDRRRQLAQRPGHVGDPGARPGRREPRRGPSATWHGRSCPR